LVTVGICCYNREQGFKNTLDYITGQTYKNLEIIISQDFNPTMDFSGIAAGKNDKRITFYKQQQRLSMYNNFLFLLEKAKGEYFMWAADDDWWSPEFVEKIMHLLRNNPSAVLGFTDFMEVDENNNRIAAYPHHLQLLQSFTVSGDVKRVKNYINQFEGFGKANLFYSIFKIEALRSKQVVEILKKGDLPGDMLINLSVLTKGCLAVVPEILRTCTVGNVKEYVQQDYEPKIINLFIAYLDVGGVAHIYKKWSGFIFDHFRVIRQSELSFGKKAALYPLLIKKLALFYYDLVCNHLQLRGYNLFSKIKRLHSLN